MDNVIDTNLKAIESFKNEVLKIFEDTSDELFGEMKVELLNSIAKAYSGPEAEQAIEQLLIEGDKNGFTLDVYVQELSHTVELFSGVMEEIKEEYKDQPNKCEFCDEFMSLIEAYILTAINKITNRDIFNVAVELCHPNAKLPTYAHDTDWGADVYAVEDMTIQPGSYGVMVPTGLRVAIPHGWMISFRPRSGMSHKTPLRLSNSPGTIDEGYEGLKSHWMRLSHEKSGLSVLVEDDFPVVKFYGWNMADAFCPETFVKIDLEPGERYEYDRVYTFCAE